MNVAILTREFPPDVYGGAGVHVEYLTRELARHVEVTVHRFGSEPKRKEGNPAVVDHRAWKALAGDAPHLAALRAVSIDLTMAAAVEGADLAHSHTWYANLGGHLAKLLYGIPHVATVHSLEPLRPWKAEQLGGGYALSSFCERVALESADAVIAVSAGHGRDILECYPAIDPERVHVIRNGIDTEEYRPDAATDALGRLGVDPAQPYVLFVGRITRQKGLTHLLDAALGIDPAAQLVLCASSPDTPEIAAEIAEKLERVQAARRNVIWVSEMVLRPDLIQLLSHATVFVCPSVYEPLGIVNLEAMACETAVVATHVGGIPEVVDDGVTGLLLPFEPATGSAEGSLEPSDPVEFAADLAARVNELLADPERAARFGRAGRERVVREFSWSAVAVETVELYDRLLS